ncbi:MAG: 3'-5' exonuclease [Elainellaceae cyanobacterium]
MLNLLIIDTETTGTDPTQDRVIEIGAVLYSAIHQSTLYQLSFLLYAPDNAAEPINRIPPAALLVLPDALQQKPLQLLQNMAAEASYVVAHNADFDTQWFDDTNLPILRDCSQNPLQWLCSMADMNWPKQSRSGQSLINLALDHGIGISSAHRALTDCQLLAELFNRLTPYEMSDLVNQALRPKALFRALVSYDNRQLAKNEGFKWHAEDKTWRRRLAIEDADQLPFQVVQI